MIYSNAHARISVVIMQLLFLSLPIFADFNPSNPPEPNITRRLTVGVTPAEAGWAYGEGNYREGDNVYIYTYPSTGDYTFLYWTINGYIYNYNSDFNYTMGDSAVSFIAHYKYDPPTPPPFAPGNPPEPYVKQYISVELDPNEGGYTDGSGSYTTGEYVWIAANLESNYELQYWTINGYPWHETGTGFYYVVGDTNAHFVAHIAEKNLLTLRTKPRAAGTSTMAINGYEFTDMLVASGKVIDFNTSKNEDYIFRHWTINGYPHSTATSFQYTMGDSAASVVAVYDYIGQGDTTLFNPDSPPEPDLREDVTIIVISADETKGTVDGGGTYLYGTIDTLYAYPTEGFAFRYWNDGIQDNPRIIQATQDSVFIAYFGNDTVVWNDTICYGTSLQIGDSVLTNSGHYEFYTLRPDGYFTWNIVDLTVWHQMSSTLDATICAGESFIYEGVEYTQPGTYPLTLQNAFGCDSLVTLTLNVLPQVEDHEEHITICYGETYTWPVNGVTYDASTIVYDTTLNANGCDSLNILYLTVLPQLQPIYDSITINDGSAATWNGVEYTKSGDYTTTLYDANGCPQAAYLHLYISSTSYLDDAFCQGDIYTWQGHYHADGTTPLTFTSAGTYTDTLADINGNDSICVLILEEVPMPNLVVRPDTMIYPGESVLLWATGADYISWSPTEYITQTDELISYATPIVTTTYTATGYNMPEGGGNLVYNGNFDLGNVGFETDCSYFEPYGTIGGWGTYTIADDVQGFWRGLVGSTKAYGGSGNMMILDGYTTAHSVVWSQTVTVQPHTFYAFSAQIMSAWDSNIEGQYALLQFAVNDEPVGSIFHSPDELYTWEKFYNVWYSGDNTTAVLTIYNQNDNPYGNDFALDEIQFAQLHEGCEDSKTVTIAVISNSVVDTTVCTSEVPFEWNGLSANATGIYQATLASSSGLLDSIVTLNLTVLEPTFTTVSDTICYGESYTWSINGETYHNSVVVSDTLADSNGCDSVITLHLTMLPEVPITIISDTICYGDTYTWATNGQTYSTSTTVYDTLSNSYACDSIVVLQLHVRSQVPLTEETVVVKFGETYTWHGTTYDASGDYQLTILDSHGCDSTLVLHLTVLPETPVTEFNSFICEGDSLTWQGLSCTTSGDYSVTVQDANGYDSILIMHLTVLEPTFTTVSDTICYGESYTWAENGKTYTKSATVSVKHSSIYGCDSTITLHLTVLPANTETVVTEQFCFYDTFTWPLNGKSYNTSATDTVTLLDRHGCDSVVILHLTQLPHHETIIQDTICYGDTYLWAENGQSYSSSVVDSIVLPDSNGCDSVIFLHLTMLPEIPQTIYQDTICQGDKYTWYLTGQPYTTNTDTSVVLTNINGCDSVVRLMLYVRPIQETITNMTICYGESFEWEGNIYTTTTKRSLKYQDIYGCDSIVTLNLTVIPQIPTTTLYETICYGHTYVFAGQICDSTATYTATLASTDGCDSTVTLHLTVLPEVPITEEYATICYGETYTWHAATYNASGDYTTTLLDANGCDSLITLHLTVLPEVPITEEYATICYGETYTWHATTYNASGDYTTTLLDANGCDSLITLHLTVLPEVPMTHLYDTICNGYTYTWQGTTYNTSGDYTTTLLDANGCDSIVTLHLHVLQDIQPTEQHVSICYGETYVWNGAVYDQSGGYSTMLTSVHGCDSIVKLILTVLPQNPITEETVTIAFGTSYNWHGESYSVAGDYTTTLTDSHGCDSIVILHLQTVNSNLSVTTFEQCADDPFLEFYIDDYTTFRNIAFQWDEAAHSQHLHDTIVPVTGPYVSIPNTARAGVYDVQVSAVFNGQHFGAQSLAVTLLYPSSVLDQHWDDFIGVLTHDYNGGYDFVSFQWYKDNEPLPGETRSYLSSALEFGASYSAMLEDANGVKLMTCPIIATPQTEISLYPSMLTPRQMIHIHTSQYATIQFFTLTGDLLYSTQQEPGEILLQAPDRTGLYIVQIMYHDNTNRVLTRKITVR